MGSVYKKAAAGIPVAARGEERAVCLPALRLGWTSERACAGRIR